MMDNPHWRLARTPTAGWPVPEDFAWQSEPAPEPGPGQLLSRTIYLSLDPYQWGRRRSGTEKPGDICHGRTVSQVVRSRHSGYAEGDFLFNTQGWQTFGLTGDGIDHFGYMFPRRIDPAIAPISTAVGVLGMLGLTAYAGLLVQCEPKPGETVVVSAASGGVGQVAGQLARLQGCRVVGVTSTAEKCAYVRDELKFDAAVSHLAEDFPGQLATACPEGIDVYFENVGGRVYEAVLPLLNRAARITICGMISQYGNTDGRNAAEVWMETGRPFFDRQGVRPSSLFVGNYVADYQQRFLTEMADWLRDGLISYREDIWDGLDQAPGAFAAMLKGGNFGKTLVAVAPDPTR
ncbi:MAG: NADP-dependent oxidoreductase [Pseudomonadales bacterium]|nr:NADP-dependent oxidoreductase [Pseudomonadales bacterium]